MTILDEIVSAKKKELVNLIELKPVKALEISPFFSRETISLSESIDNKLRTGIIAEFKRKSPSKGIFNSTASVADVTSGYFREGASGVSVLTDYQYFGGSLSDLVNARESGNFPILRKDFIISEYQVIESKAFGADAILLIAAVLGRSETRKLAELANSLGMEVILEVHDPEELVLLNRYVNIVGVNNRNLKTFDVNINISEKVANIIQKSFLKISESGISSPLIIEKLKRLGYNGFLIGEIFMKNSDPVTSFSEFAKSITSKHD